MYPFLHRRIFFLGLSSLLALSTLTARAQQPAPVQDWAWAHHLSPMQLLRGGTVKLGGLAAVPDGSYVVGGSYTPDLGFDNDPTYYQVPTSSTNPNPDRPLGYLARYAASGTLIWSTSLESPSYSEVLDVKTDAAGNLYVLGHYAQELHLGPQLTLQAPNTSRPRGFMARLTPAGVPVWAINLPQYQTGPWRLAVNPKGEAAILGQFVTNTQYGGVTLADPQASPSQVHAFILRISSAGQFRGLSAGYVSGPNIDGAVGFEDVALTEKGEVYIAGFSDQQYQLQFGTLSPLIATSISTGFVVKLDSLAVPRWQLLPTTSDQSRFHALSVLPDGSCLVGGRATNTTLGGKTLNLGTGGLCIARVSGTGQVQRFFGRTNPGAINRLAGGANGTLALLSALNAGLTWDAVQLPEPGAAGYQAINVVLLDTTGVALRGWQGRGPNAFEQPQLLLDAQSQPVVAGQFWYPFAPVPFTFGSQSVRAAIGKSAVIARTASVRLGTARPTAVAGLELFPNPAHGTVTLRLGSPAQASVRVLDALGRVVRQQPVAGGTARLHLVGLPAGLYVVAVEQGAARSFRRLQVQ